MMGIIRFEQNRSLKSGDLVDHLQILQELGEGITWTATRTASKQTEDPISEFNYPFLQALKQY